MHRAILPVLFISCIGFCQEKNTQHVMTQSLAVRALAFEVAGTNLPLGRVEIFVKDSPTSKPKRLVEGLNPTWSPDGRKIAYCVRLGPTSFGQVELMNADGSGHTQLTNVKGGACPTDWSHDGKDSLYRLWWQDAVDLRDEPEWRECNADRHRVRGTMVSRWKATCFLSSC